MHAARRLSLCAAVILGVGVPAAPAGAYVYLTTFSEELQFSNLGHASATATGTGVSTVNPSVTSGHLYTLSLASFGFSGLNTAIAVTDPIVTAGGVVEVRLTDVIPRPDLQGGVFAPISGVKRNTAVQLTQNTMPSTGNVRICLFYAGCNSGSLDLVVGATENGVYIGAGVGGLLTIGGEGAIRISLLGAPGR